MASLPVTLADVTPKLAVRRLPRGRCPKRGFWWSTAVALGHLVLAIAVLSGIGHSGARYFYCEAFGLMATDPCADASYRNRVPFEVVDEAIADCCEVVTLPAIPDGARVANPGVLPAACVAVTPAGWQADGRAGRQPCLHGLNHLRARPPPRGPTEARAQFMVFLT